MKKRIVTCMSPKAFSYKAADVARMKRPASKRMVSRGLLKRYWRLIR